MELYSQRESVTNSSKIIYLPLLQNLKYCPIHLPLHVAKRIVQFHGVMHLAYFRYFFACDELSLHVSFPISKTCSTASTTAVGDCVQLSHIWQGNSVLWSQEQQHSPSEGDIMEEKNAYFFCKNWILWWIVLITAN